MAKIVIVGNSAAGFSCTETLVRHSPDHEITVISQEPGLPYKRDLLIDYLDSKVKEEELFFCSRDFYEKNKVKLINDSKVVRVDTRKKQVVLKNNNKIGYDYLVVSTGARARIPDIPGKGKDGVYSLYTLEDAQKFKQQLILADTLCLVGEAELCSRFLGASSVKDKHTKIISSPKPESFSAGENVEWLDNLEITEIIGEGAQLKAFKLNNGKVIATPLILFIGNYFAATDFLKESGIVTDQGYICTDEAMRTNIENIFACGSVSKIKNQLIKCKSRGDAANEGAKAASTIVSLLERSNNAMSEVLVQLGSKGADTLLSLTRQSLEKLIAEKGKDAKVGFPETNYYLPLVDALLNIEVKTLGDCLLALAEAEKLNKNIAAKSGLVIASLGGILNKGVATLVCEEILAALEVLNNNHPNQGFTGFIPDNILRSLGIQLVDGRIAGIAVILGPAKDEEAAVKLVRDFQTKGIVSLLAGSIEGKTFKAQLESQGVELGLENYIVPLGEDYLSAIYAVNFAVRAPLTYGGHKPGQWGKIADYIRNRVPAFVLLLGHVDEVLVATGLGALAFGLPIITDLEVPQLGKIDTTRYEALVTEKDYSNLVSKCILTRGIKVKLAKVDVPVPYAAAFEGERVRKEQLHAEFGGKVSTAFEFLITKNLDEVEDGKVEVVGPDIDQLEKGSKSMPLAIVVEVAGRKMQKDFEPILERQVHRYTNYAMGLMHIGQRDMNWIRISKDAFNKGFRLKHIGVILHAMIHEEYNAIVDKVQVKIYSKSEDVEKLLPQARKVFDERDARLSGMTDESVDTFYSCMLCQSFAPNHVCIITPERLGLCGAYSWLDGKASYEITPTGPNQPVLKGELLDAKLGQWKNINDFVYQKSNKSIEKVSMYSLMEFPQSSCGCFECIAAIIPEANGVMIVHRDYSGMTPCGMSFTTLAGSVGGGVQTPGFLGIGKLYIISKKFISAEGGLKRVVWMPKELKELLGDKLKKAAEDIGMPELADKICDETQATTSEELLNFLNKVGHPALNLPAMI
ncbi:MAG: CO dehydrogenase/CO-methylating acetyl-CoA synthase complex subunit beta [Candidatus Omnitrophota bacterium]|nr:MAG: CO dehydrogenase/CO-methylating acetyl-CoA synthase complex subunit beta [Candidatus Omnitrophota bacterium]